MPWSARTGNNYPPSHIRHSYKETSRIYNQENAPKSSVFLRSFNCLLTTPIEDRHPKPFVITAIRESCQCSAVLDVLLVWQFAKITVTDEFHVHHFSGTQVAHHKPRRLKNPKTSEDCYEISCGSHARD